MNLLEHYQQYPDDFMIIKHPEKDLYLVKYHHLGCDWTIDHALIARGLILNSNGEIVAKPYTKFFNYNELTEREDLPREIRDLSNWDEGLYDVSAKFDGSYIIVFEYEGELIFASSGSFTSEHAKSAKKLYETQFNENQRKILSSKLEDNTLLFEYIGPSNFLVVEYEENELALIGIINNTTFTEMDPAKLKSFGKGYDIKVPETYSLRLEDLLEIQESIEDIEGFVVYFKSTGKRLKIKTKDYFEKSRSWEPFFSSMFVKKKITMMVENIFEDTYDDLLAASSKHKKAHAQILEFFGYYRKFEKRMKEYVKMWEKDKLPDHKEIATNEEYADIRVELFLAQKPRDRWKRHFLSLALSDFMARPGVLE